MHVKRLWKVYVVKYVFMICCHLCYVTAHNIYVQDITIQIFTPSSEDHILYGRFFSSSETVVSELWDDIQQNWTLIIIKVYVHMEVLPYLHIDVLLIL